MCLIACKQFEAAIRPQSRSWATQPIVRLQVKERLRDASMPDTRQKLSRLLQAALQGLQSNPTTTPEVQAPK